MEATVSYITEYERKFAYSVDTELKLSELGATMIKQEVLEDIYYDTVEYHFALHDHWLRKRNGTWELKCCSFPHCKKDLGANVESISKYREVTNENEIKEVLCSLLQSINQTDLATEISNIGLTNMLTSAQFKIVAKFQSNRKKYSIENLTIDLDETDFGFRVGEIECLVQGEGTAGEATERINELAATLGIPNEKVCGKMETYLKMKNPNLLQNLMTRGILSPTDC